MAVLGWALIPIVVVSMSLGRIEEAPVMFAVLALCVALGEFFPIQVPGKHDELTTSTCVMYALLITFGLAPAVIAQAAASLVADLSRGKSLLSVAFNVGQYTVALVAAGLVLSALSDLPRASALDPITPADLPALAVAGAVFFSLNNLLAGVAVGFTENTPILTLLRSDLGFQARTSALLLGSAPIVVAVGQYGVFLLPLMLLPLMAIYRGSREARLNEYRSLHDQLTELPNRVLFRDRAQQSIAAARRYGTGVAVLIMDLDRFKEVNDTLGHHHGDLLLQQVGARIRGSLRANDTVGAWAAMSSPSCCPT